MAGTSPNNYIHLIKSSNYL